MSQDVSQWLEEIKSLQQELARVQQERDAAHASTDHWRGLYNTEAQQRRTEAKINRDTIESLSSEIERLRGEQHSQADNEIAWSELEEEVEELAIEQLKAKLFEAIRQYDRARSEISRLTEALKAEKAVHEQTRQSLTSALGDTVELLKKAQNPRNNGPSLKLSSLGTNPPGSKSGLTEG